MAINQSIRNILRPGRKCIVNTDLDGILTGMLLQRFLNWDVVGYSSCCGKSDDELWLKNKDEDITECVFVDLPVSLKDVSVIDQHFVAFDDTSVVAYNSSDNKANPNIMCKRVFRNISGKCEYTSKYPFGTVHFTLALLEELGAVDKQFSFDFRKGLNGFDVADLILRADRVIGNTYSYTQNCLDWADWIIQIGGHNTRQLFNIVKTEYQQRKAKESNVESALISIGCGGRDGDCANLFRTKNYNKIGAYFTYLSQSTGLPSLPNYNVHDFGKLSGRRFSIEDAGLAAVKNETKKDNVFSFAFVSSKMLSLTYIEQEKK